MPADVCILDASFTSCVVALLLAKQGVRVTLIQSANTICPEIHSRLPIFWPSLNDPPTRAAVAHGVEVAQFLNTFCQRGVEFFDESLSSMISLKGKKISKVWRVGFEDFETTELQKAVEQNLLEKSGANDRLFSEFGYGFYVDHSEIQSSLEIGLTNEKLITVLKKQVVTVEKPEDVCITTFDDGSEVKSELVLCNEFKDIRRLFPKFKDALVPMSDVVLHATVKNNTSNVATVAARSSNGHAAGCFDATPAAINLWFSGPRFMLPQAGANIVLTPDGLNDDLKNRLLAFHKTHLLKEFSSVLPGIDVFADSASWNASIDYDCWPCDELPILGELGLAGRALGCAGWLASHFSAGSEAAKTLADFVLTGKNKHFHPLLDPRRLFIA